ncbi:dihydroneopterin aldolase [Caballeronia sp. LZ062]|uniref:dihydroneopterin aldolase n=1 Tax=unclassified Caballeronia TaxID=2646786 RepID=UPI002863E0FE|nr:MULTISPECIES: dihydroneopterin aldolase [unclassified Caballeronia]MDR5857061.1 dihydroneopterin aldolase [Caballeronia sp. LZ050]MDR5869543.1 dihydroneopterin aldolase [Caballeronia sp. LZ062]
MKPFEPLQAGGQGWRVVVDELVVMTRVGLYEHEHRAPQALVIDASLRYRGMPREDELIDYEAWCNRVTAFLQEKTHTRLLETLAVEIAALSFDEWPALDALTLALHKPKIREGTRRLAMELDWGRADYDAWRVRHTLAVSGA